MFSDKRFNSVRSLLPSTKRESANVFLCTPTCGWEGGGRRSIRSISAAAAHTPTSTRVEWKPRHHAVRGNRLPLPGIALNLFGLHYHFDIWATRTSLSCVRLTPGSQNNSIHCCGSACLTAKQSFKLNAITTQAGKHVYQGRYSGFGRTHAKRFGHWLYFYMDANIQHICRKRFLTSTLMDLQSKRE